MAEKSIGDVGGGWGGPLLRSLQLLRRLARWLTQNGHDVDCGAMARDPR